jgi:hypothetical protein
VLVHFTQRTIFWGSTDYLATCYFDFKENKWFGPFEIIADGKLITGVTGKPVITGCRSDRGRPRRVAQLRQRYLALIFDVLRAPVTAQLPGRPPGWKDINSRWDI